MVGRCGCGNVKANGAARKVVARYGPHREATRPGGRAREIYGLLGPTGTSETPIWTVSRARDQVGLKDGIELLNVSWAQLHREGVEVLL
jgi:hypothetical protein